jgi:hypothetical protein
MSWELFRQNVLNVVSQPENINNIKLVARTYATEYDACIRRGGDLINKIPLVKGDVIGMTRIFERALSNGLNSRVPYDLTGEMGKGVIQYWTNAQLSIIKKVLKKLFACARIKFQKISNLQLPTAT